MTTLVVIPCGISKIWKRNPDAGPTEAKDAYTGVPFKVNKEYAERYGDHWVILSAKYGFIEPNFIIEKDYNVTFKDPKTKPIGLSELESQVEGTLSNFDKLVALGGKDYTNIVESVFKKTGTRIITPVKGRPIGIALGMIKEAIRNNSPFE
jgi:hypothetical protein